MEIFGRLWSSAFIVDVVKRSVGIQSNPNRRPNDIVLRNAISIVGCCITRKRQAFVNRLKDYCVVTPAQVFR